METFKYEKNSPKTPGPDTEKYNTLTQAVEDPSSNQTPLTFGLLHLSKENTNPASAFLSFGKICLETYGRVYLLSSPAQEENIYTEIKEQDFLESSDFHSKTFLDASNRLGISFIADDIFVRLVGEIQKETIPQEGSKNLKNILLLFDAASFGIRFLDCLASVLNKIFILSDTNTVDLIESYQLIKSFHQTNPEIKTNFFLIKERADEEYQLIVKEFQKIVNKHLQTTFRSHHFSPADLNLFHSFGERRQRNYEELSCLSSVENEKADSYRRLIFERIFSELHVKNS